MAELVGVFAASHGPLIARDWDKLEPALRARFAAAFEELGRQLAATRPDILVAVSTDHWTNFFLDNWPSVCIGVGDRHEGPPEPFLKPFPYLPLHGHPGFGSHLFASAMRSGFEPSVSHHLALDHGICLPLLRMQMTRLPPIVPILINELEPPMPSLARCLAWGRLLGEAIRSYRGSARIALLGTGGLSHSIGEPGMGRIEEAFDRAAIGAFADGDEDRLIAMLEAGLPDAGNGAEEIRSWLVAHAAAGGRGFELVDYIAAHAVYVGCGFARWKLTATAGAAAAAR